MDIVIRKSRREMNRVRVKAPSYSTLANRRSAYLTTPTCTPLYNMGPPESP
jgi:hypothetical protein